MKIFSLETKMLLVGWGIGVGLLINLFSGFFPVSFTIPNKGQDSFEGTIYFSGFPLFHPVGRIGTCLCINPFINERPDKSIKNVVVNKYFLPNVFLSAGIIFLLLSIVRHFKYKKF